MKRESIQTRMMTIDRQFHRTAGTYKAHEPRLHASFGTIILAIAVCLLYVVAESPATAQETIPIGVAETDITPPQGFPMAGYYHERLATGTRDPLKAKAIVFGSGNQQVAVVACDLTGIAYDLTREVRARASKQTQIPETQIILTATHSHTAPDYTKDLYHYLSKDSDAAAKYAPNLVDGIVDAIVRAQMASRPAKIEAAVATQDVPVSFNRRFVMKDGSVRTWMNYENPDVVRAAGPIDPEIGIVAFRSAETDETFGVLTNFALHLDTVGGMLWSGDYPYYIEQHVRQKLGDDVISVFGTGCCGDINHVDPSSKERNTTQFIGDALGSTIEKQLDAKLQPLAQQIYTHTSAIVELPLQVPSDLQLERATKLLPAAKAGEKIEFFDLVDAHKSVLLDHLLHKPPQIESPNYISWGLSRNWAGVGPNLPVEVHVLKFGDDLAFVYLPGEVFVDLGLAIKRASPFKTTLVFELSNCVETIYIPTRAAYAGGGYEVANAASQPGSGEMLVEASIRLLKK